MSTLTEQEIDDLAEEALNAACLAIQERLGVESGDLAAAFFSDDITRDNLKDYIRQEIERAGLAADEEGGE